MVRDAHPLRALKEELARTMTKRKIRVSPRNLASLVRGLYGRVARHLDVDPSYVSRVARGERQSEAIETALEREMRQIMKMVKTNRNGLSLYGTGRRSTTKRRTAN
jgi:hypothetical protein